MKKQAWFVLMLMAAAALAVAAGEPPEKTNASPAFEQMKKLVGRWEGTTRQGQKVEAVYELVSGGTALLERYLDSNPEHSSMVTLYHPDGQHFMLTHYCAANNQPRMRAASYDAGTRTLVFEFLDVTNLANPNAGHMRRAVFKFADENNFTTEWTYYQKGKPAETELFHFKRLKGSAPDKGAPSHTKKESHP